MPGVPPTTECLDGSAPATSPVDHVVMLSGGASSWLAARRVAERYGPDNMVLLAADTRSEAPGWHDILAATAEQSGAELIVLDRGLDLWELAEAESAIPNPRMSFCSRKLKREPLDAWCARHAHAGTVSHFGMDWTEPHRIQVLRDRLAPRLVDFPLTWEPVVDKEQAIAEMVASGIAPPEAYLHGLPHNNCLRFGCVKGGQAYWKRIWETLPDTYARAEANEEALRERIGDHSILRGRNGRGTLTLRAFRERLESEPALFDAADYGSCACFIDP